MRKNILSLLLFIICLMGAANAQTITEIIDATGDGTVNNTLDWPQGIVVDDSGNVYLTGFNSDNAFKITPGGVITEIIDATGDGTPGNLLEEPFGFLALDGSGNVYVTGFKTHNAFKITPGGVITEIIDATGDGTGNNTLDFPLGIAVDGSGNVYVAGFGSDNAFKITPGGVITEIIDATGDGADNPIDGSRAIAVDGSGYVYLTGQDSDNAFKITPGGVITEIIDRFGDRTGNPLNFPFDIVVDGSGNVYVTGNGSDNVFKITPDGVITEIIDETGDGAGNPQDGALGIALDGSGNVYVTGFTTHNAFKITPDGVITEIIDATGDGTPGNPLEGPRGIAVDGSGNVYVTGLFSNNAFKIAASIHTITSSVGANGSIDPVGAVSVNNGVDQSFTITPNTGYLVADVLVDGNSVGAVTSYTFTNVLTDHTISATFKISSFGLKQAAKDILVPYLTDPDKKIRKAVEKAIKHIDKSLEAKLWVDVNHLTKKGKKVFDEEKKAVKKLKNKKFIPPFSTDALAAINFLLTADNNLAQVAINDVVCGGNSKCEKELQRANKEMAKALVEISKNKYDKAIDHYKKAWQHAQKAKKKMAVASNNESISLDNSINVPVDFTLSQNYPNPFNPSTVIKYALPEASFVTLKIYNMLGQEIKTLVSGDKSAGVYNVQWNGKDNYGSPVASGTYIYRIVTGNYAQSNKMILLK